SEIEENNSNDEQYANVEIHRNDDEDINSNYEQNTDIEDDDIPPLPPLISLPSFSPLTSPQPTASHNQPSTADSQAISNMDE
ncbi:9781_t:CDS:1, partial [Paraglomus brasilianum]